MLTQMDRTQTLTPQLVTAAAMLVRVAHPNDHSLGRALDRAGERLLTLPWRLDGAILQIASFSQPNDCHATDGQVCDCPTTRGTCWHIAAHTILMALVGTGIAPQAAVPLPAVLDEDELPGSFLDSIDSLAFDEDGGLLPPVQPVPFRPGPSRVHEVDPALQALADAMYEPRRRRSA